MTLAAYVVETIQHVQDATAFPIVDLRMMLVVSVMETIQHAQDATAFPIVDS
jgi:hypothetical protein